MLITNTWIFWMSQKPTLITYSCFIIQIFEANKDKKNPHRAQIEIALKKSCIAHNPQISQLSAIR